MRVHWFCEVLRYFFYDSSSFSDTLDFLKSTQKSNGSWEDDVYTTALVLQSLNVADREVPNPDLGMVTATVVDADTNGVLKNIEIQLVSETTQRIQTDNAGQFAFAGLHNGTYRLLISNDNYVPLESTIQMHGDILNLGILRLNKDANSTVSTLTGVIKDASTSIPVIGALIRIGSQSTMTDTNGSYNLNGIASGTQEVTIGKSGYVQNKRHLNIPANTLMYYNTSLYSINTEVKAQIKGRVLDSNGSVPLAGVQVVLSGSMDANMVTDANGTFVFTDIGQGSYNVQITKDGYGSASASGVIDKTVVVQLGDVLLSHRDPADKSVRIKGTITDKETHDALAGVRISVGSIDVLSDANGMYMIEGLRAEELNITASKDGYVSMGATATPSEGATLIFSPSMQKVDTTLSISGTILDANSSEPLSHVLVKYEGEGNLTAYTDENGYYRLSPATEGDATMHFDKDGHESVSLSLSVGSESLDVSPTMYVKDINTSLYLNTLIGKVKDIVDGKVLENVRFYINGIEKNQISDSNGSFSLTNLQSTDINLTIKKDGYKDATSLIISPNVNTLDIGTLYMRKINVAEIRPDLVVEAIKTTNIVNDADTFEVKGELNITVVNRGVIASNTFNMLLFFDMDADKNYTEGIDKKIDSLHVEKILDSDESINIQVDIDTVSQFRDQPIYVYVDSGNTNIELDENNTYSTAKSCGGKQGQIDLGVCFDYSGSVSSIMGIQKKGLIEALRDPKKFPRDGSVRLMVLTGAYFSKVYLNPTIVTEKNVDTVADILENSYFSGYDYMGDCLKKMTNTWDEMNEANQSTYRAVTLYGDGVWGPSYWYIDPYTTDRDYAIKHGVNVIDTIGIGSVYKEGLEAFVYPQPAGGDLGKVYYAKTSEDISNSLINTFKKQTSIADMTVGKLGIIDNGMDDNLSIEFTVGNAGIATIPKDINISIYKGDTNDSNMLLATISLEQNLSFGMFQKIQVDNILLEEGDSVFVVADIENNLVECTKKNNSITGTISSRNVLATIQTKTNQPTYTANQLATFAAISKNLGKLDDNLTAQLILEDSEGNIIHTFDKQALGIVASNETKEISNEWNTTDTLAGEYVIRGILTDTEGKIVDESTATFRIVHSGLAARLDLRLDRSIYHTSDSVSIDNFVQSMSSNNIIENSSVELEITDSNHAVVYTQKITLGTLLPQSTREAPDSYGYERLKVGNYKVKAVLKGDNNVSYATDGKSFKVQASLSAELKGSVTVAWRAQHVGSTQQCAYSVSNLGSSRLNDLALQLRIIDMNTSAKAYESNASIDIDSLQTINASKDVVTLGYAPKEYSCGLYAYTGSEWILLDHKLFMLTNTVPRAQEQNLSTVEDTSLEIVLQGSDADGDVLRYSIISEPIHGTLHGTMPNMHYKPNLNYVVLIALYLKSMMEQ